MDFHKLGRLVKNAGFVVIGLGVIRLLFAIFSASLLRDQAIGAAITTIIVGVVISAVGLGIDYAAKD